jgi:ParB/RepB/Spo0J family partition protein
MSVSVLKKLPQEVTYTVLQIPLRRIRAFDFQPRKYFDPEEIRARAASMKALGQQDPVTVERIVGDPDHDYELINGESRLRSAKEAGLKTLWAAVRSVPFESRTEKHMASLVANFNRSDHTPMEISDALHIQVTEGRRSQAEVARAIGKTDFWVCSYLSLQDLHPEIQKLLHPTVHKSNRLATTIGFELAKIPSDRQLEIYELAKRGDGKITRLRVQIEIERLHMLERKARNSSPSRRREKIENTIRALKLDVEKLQTLCKDRSVVGVIEEGIDALQSAKSQLRREKRDDAPEMLDTERMSREELEAYVDAWREYWLSLPAPHDGDFLLLEVAYPKWGSSLKRKVLSRSGV